MTGHIEARQLIDGKVRGAERTDCLRHALACTSCRANLAREEPSLLFALLALEKVSPAALDELSLRVERGVEEIAGRRTRRSGWIAAGALAASLLLAIGLGALALWNFEPRGPGAASSAAPRASIERRGGFEESTSVHRIRLISSPGAAQTMDLSVGTTRVTMIFDRELGL